MTEFDPQIHGPELSAYLDGELDAADRAAVDQLLAGSPAARRELEQLRAISGGLRGLSRHAAPDAVLAGIGARDKRHTVHSEAPLGPRSSRRIWKVRAWFNTLATAAALGLVWIAGRAFTSNGSVTGELARVSADSHDMDPSGALNRAEPERVAMGGITAPPAAPTAPGTTGDPTVASVSKPAGLPLEPVLTDPLSKDAFTDRITLGHDVAVGRIRGFVGGGDARQAEPAPVCNVVVNTRSPEEYEAVQTWVADVSRAQANAMSFWTATHAGKSPQQPELLQLKLPSSELQPVLTSLGDRVAPGVRIAIEFVPLPADEADSQLAYRHTEEAKSESRDQASDETRQAIARGIAAAGYAGSLRETAESEGDIKNKEAAPAENKPRAAGEAAPPAPAAVAAPTALAERNQPSRDVRQSKDEAGARGGGRASGDDKNVAAKPDFDDAAIKSANVRDAGREGRKDQNYKFGADAPAVASPANGAASRGVSNEDAESVENRSASRGVQNQLTIQNELNNAIQLQSQSNVPIPLRFALPQLQNRIAWDTVTVNLIVNRPPPPADSQPASMPNR